MSPEPSVRGRGACFTLAMADPMLDTASQRPATGLDANGRVLIAKVLRRPPGDIVAAFFRDQYASYPEYFLMVDEVWGPGAADLCVTAVREAEISVATEFSLSYSATSSRDAAAQALLETMPEPDFRTAIHRAFQWTTPEPGSEQRITRICRSRAAPWEYDRETGFRWVGDEQVEEVAVRPALSAIEDTRFAGGVKAEFESARAEMALGTPTSLRQSVHQSGCAVESAMKVVLAERGVPYDEKKDTMKRLFDHLVAAAIVPRTMEWIVLGAMTPRNRWGGHGAGGTAHVVELADAEAVFGSAAVAITYLQKQLPR